MTPEAVMVWVGSSDGELIRADSIIGVRCRDGVTEACRAGGGWLQVAGPGCPQDFHVGLLAALPRAGRSAGDRWVVIVSPRDTADEAARGHETTDELSPPG